MNQAEAIGERVSKWGEGPIWHNNQLIYVDIEAHTIIFYSPKQDLEKVITLDQRIGFIAPAKHGNWIWGGDKGLYSLDANSQKSTLIIDPEPNYDNNRFNDGKVAPNGLLFAGTISLIKQPEANLYRLNTDKSLTKIYSKVTNSNGLAWSIDHKTLYYIDTPSKEVKAFDYNNETGDINNNPKIIIDTSNIPASPDGMCIDDNGNLWIAFCHGGCVINYETKTGREIRRITVPALETTSCCFGGEKGNDLYITTALHKTQKEELGGRLFVVKDLDVSGRPSHILK